LTLVAGLIGVVPAAESLHRITEQLVSLLP
jgi:hypothetical protein